MKPSTSLERRIAAFKKAIGENIQLPQRNPLPSRCRARAELRKHGALAVRYGLDDETFASSVRACLGNPSEADDALLHEVYFEARGAVPLAAVDSLGQAADDLGRKVEEEEAARVAAARDAQACQERHAAWRLEMNVRSVRELGDDGWLIGTDWESAPPEVKALRSQAFRYVDGLIAIPVKSFDGYVCRESKTLVEISGMRGVSFWHWKTGEFVPSVTNAMADDAPRARGERLMKALRSEPRAKMAERDFLDPESPRGKHERERYRAWLRPMLAAIFEGGRIECDPDKLLDRGVCGQCIVPDLAVDDLRAVATEEWLSHLKKAHPDFDVWEAQRAKTAQGFDGSFETLVAYKPRTRLDVQPLPAWLDADALMKRTFGIVEGRSALSRIGEFLSDPPGDWPSADAWADVVAFVSARDTVRTEEIVERLREAGHVTGEVTTEQHTRIGEIMTGQGFQKKQPMIGQKRRAAWVRS